MRRFALLLQLNQVFQPQNPQEGCYQFLPKASGCSTVDTVPTNDAFTLNMDNLIFFKLKLHKNGTGGGFASGLLGTGHFSWVEVKESKG